MKKVAFAIQVLVVLAMFPTYMIIEIRHGMPKEKLEQTTIQVSVDSELQNENAESDIMITGPTTPLIREILK